MEDKEIQAFCPNCGENAMPEDTCMICGFCLGTIIKCPHKLDSNICALTKTSCVEPEGMDWEACNERTED